MAELSTSVTALPANGGSGPEVRFVPPPGSAVTTFTTDLAIITSSSTGDSGERAEMALRFQPVADRAAGGYTNAIYFRIELMTVPGGLLARRFFYECLDAVACSTTASVGLMTAGNWGSTGVVVSQGTLYQASLSWLSATKVVTFTLSSGGNMLGSATLDLQQGSAGSPALAAPFDVSPETFMRGFLTAVVIGGAVGGGDGSIVSHFDNVYVGMDDAPPTLFDDFDAETTFDPAKWVVTGSIANIVPAG